MPRKAKTGRVVSTAMVKTIVVQVERLKQHPRYKKYIRVRKKFMAHDENEQATVGDTVRIVECPPRSKRKAWELAEVVTRGVGPEVELRPDAGVEEMLQARKEEERAAAQELQAEAEVPESAVTEELAEAPSSLEAARPNEEVAEG